MTTAEARAKLKAMFTAYSVLDEWDGCPDGVLFTGTRDQCVRWIGARYDKLFHGKASVGLRNNVTGRMESFVC